MKKDSQDTAKDQLEFPGVGRKSVRPIFDAKALSSDGGAILLAQADRKLGFVEALAACIRDKRDPRYIAHDMILLLRQRIFQIDCGYEDCNDADTLRYDPVLKTCCGRDPENGADLASQPTLSRLENDADSKSCFRMAEAFVQSYIDRHPKRPTHIVLDIDTSEDRTYGNQQLSFFNNYYDHHVYLPLFIFDQDGDLILPVLLPGKARQNVVVAAVLDRVIARLRGRWSGIRILLRGDSEFAAPHIYNLVEHWGLDMLIGTRAYPTYKKLAAKLQARALKKFLRTKQKVRLFTSARHRAKEGWSRSYRLIFMAEHSAEGPNLRVLMTNLTGTAGDRYEEYGERGESSENSIKDLKNALKSDRLSCGKFHSNQFRLFLHGAAYVLMYTLRQAARGTEFAAAQMDTLRLKLLKIGARVRTTTRRIWFHLAESYPYQRIWDLIARRLLPATP